MILQTVHEVVEAFWKGGFKGGNQWKTISGTGDTPGPLFPIPLFMGLLYRLFKFK